MKSILLVLTVLAVTHSIAFSQVECPSCDKYLDYIYDYLHIEKKTNLKQDFKEWFFSSKFEDQYKNNNTNLSITIPIYGVPVTFGGSNESENAWTKRDSVSKITSFQIDYSAYESVVSKSATGQSREDWLTCVTNCYEHSGLNPVKISAISSNDQSITFNISYVYSTGASIPVIIDFTGNGVDLSSTKKFQGQIMNTNGTAITVPWNNQGETSALISINTTRGTATTGSIEKPLPTVQIQYSYATYEDEMVGTKSTYIQNWGCNNCGEDHATSIPGFLFADPNNYFKNGRFVYKHNPGGWTNILPVEYWFEMPPNGRRATSDSAKIVVVITKGWGPVFDGDLIADVYTKRKIINQSSKEVQVVNKKVLFDIPGTAPESESYLVYRGQKYLLSTLQNQPFIKSFNSTGNSIERDYQIEFK